MNGVRLEQKSEQLVTAPITGKCAPPGPADLAALSRSDAMWPERANVDLQCI